MKLVLQQWATWRAALLSLVLCVMLIDALPRPGQLSANRLLRSPNSRQELDGWVKLLDTGGVSTSRQQLAQRVASISSDLDRIPDRLLTGFAPFFALTGTQQGWTLFSYPDANPFRLVLAAAEPGGEFVTLYESGHASATYAAEIIEYRRVRGLYHPRPRLPRTYEAFAAWLARRVFSDFANCDRVRVEMHRQRTALPESAPPAPPRVMFRREFVARGLDVGPAPPLD